MGRPIFHDSYEHWESYVTVRRSSIFAYDVWQQSRDYTKRKTPVNNKNKGSISKKSKILIQQYVGLLFDAAKIKTVWCNNRKSYFKYTLGFLTLTLPSPQIHTDREIYEQCFKPFLRHVSKKRNDFLYIWKAETQDNGNIHFHITTNSFLHYHWVQMVWDSFVEKLGYCSRSNNYRHNSTEIRSVRNEKTLAIYLAKYLGKSDHYKKRVYLSCPYPYTPNSNNGIYVSDVHTRHIYELKRPISIKLWDCSEAIKGLKMSSVIDFNIDHELQSNFSQIIEKTTENAHIMVVDKDTRKLLPHTMSVYYRNVLKLRDKTYLEQSSYILEEKKVKDKYQSLK